MNLPNRLTVIRVIMIPFFVFFMLTDAAGNASKWIALFIFCAASFTDYLDGHIARKYNLITNFGKFMDPLADKLLVCSAFVCFVELSKLSAWIVIVIISREFIISGFRLVACDKGVVIAASIYGKFKTVTQMAMIILLIIDIADPVYILVTKAVTYIALIMTVVSLADYLIKNKDVMKEAQG
ncbi:MAG: CDP-diacylglycerol--glycerol-3-phosphate 3-phosphatidyltransferase [Lachnospiraceae bacterium]|nr:CDP-diacylglycerol--glycerol-3-phosphate 3-phosphatidyltransferase [Lachnospiraceae bacterium]